ncbi:MAG: ABC transporter ATP-binding protein [Proteobacteria bacterium]|nr:ABC transporter ATP-binding protein [Pseudomonadota bacterium]MDA1300084.1 ABC transporter ATP-binding protein [Pseudomonadota bacterium]
MNVVTRSPKKSRYSAFDADLTGKALNYRMFVRLLGWIKPYWLPMLVSIVFIVIAAVISVMIPIVTGRVVIDTIMLPRPELGHLPDYGMVDLTEGIASGLDVHLLWAATGVWLGLTLGSAVARYIHRLTLSSAVLRALRDLRNDLFERLEDKPASFYDHVSVGRVMTRVTNDVSNLFELLSSVGNLAGEFVPFFLALFLMWNISPDLTLIVLLILPLVGGAVTIFRRLMSDTFRRVRNSVSNLNQYMQESLIGMEVVQLSGREERNEARFGELNKTNRRLQYKATNYETVFGAFNNSLGNLVIACIIYVGGGLVVEQTITLGSVVLFTQLIGMMINPVVMLSEQFNTLFRSMASGERIFQALDWQERVKEPDDPVMLPETVRGEIEFRHVNFGYYDDEEILHDVSVKVEAGRKLAIVGATGSGKSTMIRLLARFYDFDDGMIFLDGIDVNRIRTRDLRARVGVVLQDFHIFSGTVLDNITLNNPSISDAQAKQAARRVHAHLFIEQLPDGYDTYLSERGQNLSQGQRQLLAFARVLAADPEILVLDEATANIDTATELIIQEALHVLMSGRTSIVIAHRLATIQDCDHILVLHHGVVQEYGTHEELMARGGIYYTLHELQFQDSRAVEELLGALAGEQRPSDADDDGA